MADRKRRTFPPDGGATAYLQREMDWYDGQARRSMYGYRAMSVAELLAAAAVTVLSSAAEAGSLS